MFWRKPPHFGRGLARANADWRRAVREPPAPLAGDARRRGAFILCSGYKNAESASKQYSYQPPPIGPGSGGKEEKRGRNLLPFLSLLASVCVHAAAVVDWNLQ